MYLVGAQRPIRLGGRHPPRRASMFDAADQQAGGRIAGTMGPTFLSGGDGVCADVEAKIALAGFLVGAVAIPAVAGQDGADVTVESIFARAPTGGAAGAGRDGQNDQQ